MDVYVEDQNLHNYFKGDVNHLTQYIMQYYPNYVKQLREMNQKECTIDDIREINTHIAKIAFSYYDRFYENKYQFYDFKRLLGAHIAREYIPQHEVRLQALSSVSPNRAVCVFITDKAKQYTLLLQCGYNINRYSFLKGAIEHGETPELAAERELYEELGVNYDFSKIHSPFTDHDVDGIPEDELLVQKLVLDTEYQLIYVFYLQLDLDQAFTPLSREEVSLVVKMPIVILQQQNNVVENILAKPFNQRELVIKILKHFNI